MSQQASGFDKADVKEEGGPIEVSAAFPEPKESNVRVWLEISGTLEDFAALRHALTGKKHEFVRRVALKAENISKGKIA